MYRITLQFKTERDLRSFFNFCKIQEAEMNFRNLTMLYNCNEKEIDLAVNAFEAFVVRREPIQE